MTPAEFIKKWGDSRLRERQGSHEHFIDLCNLLEEPTPASADSVGDTYCFERGAEKVGGGDGWADVWRKGCFGWEYKGKHKDLNAALRQLQTYAPDLQNPPYLVVSDMERIIVHTNWTNTIRKTFELKLDDLHEPDKLAILKSVFEGSDRLRPKLSPQELTATVAVRFGALGRQLQERKHHPRAVAHFLNKVVFCMFAEDARLLPKDIFTKVVRASQDRPAEAAEQLGALFEKMRSGGLFGADRIKHFNGGLFEDAGIPAFDLSDLKMSELKTIADTAGEHDWSELDPAIFGNLFEEALKATRERPALGAHYTDREKILKIVEPVVVRPLTAEWEETFAQIDATMMEAAAADAQRRAVLDEAGKAMAADPSAAKAAEPARRKKVTALLKRRSTAEGKAKDLLESFLSRLDAYRVLDPACGSGNFLYVALHALKDLERRALVDAERVGVIGPAPRVGLQCVRGIEIEEYAAELARVTLWIGDLQWNARNNFTGLAEPVLSNLDQIENRDALLNEDGTEAEWPEADAIIGNPPFVGAKLMKRRLSVDYTIRLRRVYSDRLPGFSDFVCFWFEKLRYALAAGNTTAGGFIATSSVTGGTNQPVMQRIEDELTIFDAWDRFLWVDSGKNVQSCITCICKRSDPRTIRLNGVAVEHVNSDLTTGVNVTRARKLRENTDFALLGIQQSGPLDVAGPLARRWLKEPSNPNGTTNAAVLRWCYNGDDITGRPRDVWIIDLPFDGDESAAALFEMPFEHLAVAIYDPDNDPSETLKQARGRARDRHAREKWWAPYWPRPELRTRLLGKKTYLATAETSEHFFFTLVDARVLPDKNLIVFPDWDFVKFGVLESRFHRVWALRAGTSLSERPRYTYTTAFEPFPFPEGLTPNISAADYADDPRAVAISESAAELNRLREAWLNPPDLIRVEPEVVPGYPDRILPKDADAWEVLKKRTLTNLYNERPAWLDMAHRRLDAAVAAAYGWPADLSDEGVLERLFALNQERAAAGR